MPTCYLCVPVWVCCRGGCRPQSRVAGDAASYDWTRRETRERARGETRQRQNRQTRQAAGRSQMGHGHYSAAHVDSETETG